MGRPIPLHTPEGGRSVSIRESGASPAPMATIPRNQQLCRGNYSLTHSKARHPPTRGDCENPAEQFPQQRTAWLSVQAQAGKPEFLQNSEHRRWNPWPSGTGVGVGTGRARRDATWPCERTVVVKASQGKIMGHEDRHSGT